MRELAAATIAVALFGIVVAALMLFPVAVLAPLVGGVLIAIIGLILIFTLMATAL